jgi:hypothetical protein
MIVISTFDDVDLLERLLESLLVTNNFDEPVLIVCTDSSKIEVLEYVDLICSSGKYPFTLLWDVTPYRGYDSGAYIFAFKKYNSDYYIFLQDSMEIKSPDWLDVFKLNRELGVVNAWVTFKDSRWDSLEQRDWVINKLSIPFLEPTYGIFGPIFQISRIDLIKIDDKWNLERFIPFNKLIGQQGMERGWSYLLYNTELSLNSLDGDYGDFENKKYFNKKFKGRR